MSTPTTMTSYQADIIQTAAAIVYVLDDRQLHPVLRQQTPLTQDQIAALGRRFTEGLERWEREVRARRAPNAIDGNRIALVATMLGQKYPNGVKRDIHNQITLAVSDIVDALNDLSADVSKYINQHDAWETLIFAIFTPNTLHRMGQSVQVAQRFGLSVAKSLGIDGIFNTEFESGQVVEADVPPMPQYPAHDPRSEDPQVMTKLWIELRVTQGLLNAIKPDAPHEDHRTHLEKWLRERASTAVEVLTKMVVPSGLSRFSAQLSNTEKVLTQSRDLLKQCIYGNEAELGNAAAQHAVERSFGTILFLAICPNVPFLIPTLELRLAITKPIYYVTRAAHEALGKIWIFGFLFCCCAGSARSLTPSHAGRCGWCKGS